MTVLQDDANELSVFMPTRRHRQLSSEENNEVESIDQLQLKDFVVNCQLDKARIEILVEFLNPFNGTIYSKGFKDDPNCM